MSRLRHPSDREEPTDDEGSILIMILVFMVVSSLIVIPMLNYAITILRANSVSIEKREDLEDVRAGARVAIADSVDLFTRCDSSALQTIPTPAVSTVSQCRELDQVGVTEKLTIPFSATALQPGAGVSTLPFDGTQFPDDVPAGTIEDWWVSDGRFDVDPAVGTFWMPDLPERETTVQNADGHQLPGSYNCQVFFPGTYEDEVVINPDRPAYFTSGVYYFEEDVKIFGGAEAIFGFGLEEGCVGDLQAVLDIDDLDSPDRFNIDGLGATLVFGGEARFIVDDTRTIVAGVEGPNTGNLPVRVAINQRYVQNEDDGGGRVAIMSVNGDTDLVDLLDPMGPTTVSDLRVPGQIFVPESQVITSGGSTVPASQKGLVPSVHTAEARVPEPPTITSVVALGEPIPHQDREGAAHISWAAPVGNDEGGSTITKYEVFDSSNNKKCETDGATECIVLDLGEINANITSTFTVVATNAMGASDPSAPMSVTVTNSVHPWSRIEAPDAPTNVVATPSAAVDAASVEWDAPTDTGHGIIASYEVKAYSVHTTLVPGVENWIDTGERCVTTAFRDQPVPTTCIVENLPELDTTPGMGPELTPAVVGPPPLPAVNADWLGYRFEVEAVITTIDTDDPGVAPPATWAPLRSVPSVPSTPVAAFDGGGTATPAAPPTMPVAPPYIPDPVVDINVSNSSSSDVEIAGYVAIPQGRLAITNPGSGSTVRLIGSSVAAAYDIDPATFGSATRVGFQDTVLQRTVEVVTTLPGSNRSSTMTLQINANGADVAVNSWVTQ